MADTPISPLERSFLARWPRRRQPALGDTRQCPGAGEVRVESAADLRRALDLWARIQHPDSETQIERARALANLAGLGGGARSGVTAAEAKAFADQSVAALAAVVKTGWALPSELREPDFDAPRGRPDFQMLFAEMKTNAAKVPDPATPPGEKK